MNVNSSLIFDIRHSNSNVEYRIQTKSNIQIDSNIKYQTQSIIQIEFDIRISN